MSTVTVYTPAGMEVVDYTKLGDIAADVAVAVAPQSMKEDMLKAGYIYAGSQTPETDLWVHLVTITNRNSLPSSGAFYLCEDDKVAGHFIDTRCSMNDSSEVWVVYPRELPESRFITGIHEVNRYATTWDPHVREVKSQLEKLCKDKTSNMRIVVCGLTTEDIREADSSLLYSLESVVSEMELSDNVVVDFVITGTRLPMLSSKDKYFVTETADGYFYINNSQSKAVVKGNDTERIESSLRDMLSNSSILMRQKEERKKASEEVAKMLGGYSYMV